MTERAQSERFPITTPQPSALPHGAQWRIVCAPVQPIGFVLQRSRRRSIGFTVDESGLTITAPTWATLRQIDEAVIKRSRWILAKLHLWQERLDHQSLADTLWKHQGRLPYLGAQITLQLGAVTPEALFHGAANAPQLGDTLHVGLPDDAAPQDIQDAVNIWLQRQARWWFDQRLRHFVAKSGQSLHSWRLSSAKTRWGSCSSKRRIMLNWRLIHFKHTIIDYVIAHEVAHLSEMNHSKAFWQEVERLMPDFASAKAELRRHRPGSLPLL